MPPWAASFVYSLLIAIFSDMFRHRYLFALVSMLISFAGYGILINVHNNLNLQYAALFLVCMGTYGAMPILVCWFNMYANPSLPPSFPRWSRERCPTLLTVLQEPGRAPSTIHRHGVAGRFRQHWWHHCDVRVRRPAVLRQRLLYRRRLHGASGPRGHGLFRGRHVGEPAEGSVCPRRGLDRVGADRAGRSLS